MADEEPVESLLHRLQIHSEETGDGAEAEVDHSVEVEPGPSDLLNLIRCLPPDELTSFIDVKLLVRLAQASKSAQQAFILKDMPRGYRLNKVWWATHEGSDQTKVNFILDELLKKAPETTIQSIILPGMIRNESFREEAAKLATVLSHCPELTHLDLSRNNMDWWALTQQEDHWTEIPWRLTNLTHLDLNDCNLNYAGLRIIDRILSQWNCAQLTHLNLKNNKLLGANGEWPTLLHKFTELRHLDLGMNYIGEGQMQCIEAGLRECTTLTHLDLSQNQLAPDGYQVLARVLLKFPGLTHLVLASTVLNDEGVGHLNPVFRQCTELLHLNISGNNIHPETLPIFFQDLSNCTSLTHLNLSFGSSYDYELTHGSTGIIAHALCSFPVLAELNLGYAAMKAQGARELAGYLPQYTALTHLRVGGNNIGEEGTLALCEVLPQCKKLSSLDMSANQIGTHAHNIVDTCMKMPAASRKFELNLVNNDITEKRQQELTTRFHGTGLVVKWNSWT